MLITSSMPLYLAKAEKNTILADVVEDSGAILTQNNFELHVGDDSNHITVYKSSKVIQHLSVPKGLFDAEAICLIKESDSEIQIAVLEDRQAKNDGRSVITVLKYKKDLHGFSCEPFFSKRFLLELREKTEGLVWDSNNNRFILTTRGLTKKKDSKKYDFNKVGLFFAFYPENKSLVELGTIGAKIVTDITRFGKYFYVLSKDKGIIEFDSTLSDGRVVVPPMGGNPEALIVTEDEYRVFDDLKKPGYQIRVFPRK